MNNTKVKKIYVKPVIESEEFVANEYVAACWVIECLRKKSPCSSYSYRGDIKECSYIHDATENHRIPTYNDGNNSGHVKGSTPESSGYFHGPTDDTYNNISLCHPVEVIHDTANAS